MRISMPPSKYPDGGQYERIRLSGKDCRVYLDGAAQDGCVMADEEWDRVERYCDMGSPDTGTELVKGVVRIEQYEIA